MSRPRRFTAAVRADVLALMAQGYSMTRAAEAAGVTRQAVGNAKKRDEAFAAEMADAFERGTDVLRDELRRRALEGVEEPVFQGGEQVGSIRKFSDTLLIFELKRRDPSYRENHRVELSGPGGGAVPVEVEGGRVTGIADVFELARQLGVGFAEGVRAGVDAGPAREALPAAPDVLPDPGDGQ